jgi:8-oxo-dGTP pyrophosphatase MutT (NUDIX family)
MSDYIGRIIDKAPTLIRESAKSPLGLLALVVLLVSILALALFATASEVVRLVIFLLILAGAGLFAFSLLQIASREQTSRPTPPPTAEPVAAITYDQVAAICYRPKGDSIELLLVRSDGGRWIFPKGSVEKGEEPWFAAQREASEKAGVVGNVAHEALTVYLHKRGLKQSGQELRIMAFPLLVRDMEPLRKKNRKPTWFAVKDAEQALVQDRTFKYAEEMRRVIRETVAALT